MTGIACAMRGCTPDDPSEDYLVTVGFDGSDVYGYRPVIGYGAIDNNTFRGHTINSITADTNWSPVQGGLQFELAGGGISQTLFRSISLHRGDGTLATYYAANADLFLNGGSNSIWVWNQSQILWDGADVGNQRLMRFT